MSGPSKEPSSEDASGPEGINVAEIARRGGGSPLECDSPCLEVKIGNALLRWLVSEGLTIAERNGRRSLLFELVEGTPRPCRVGLLKADRRGPLDILSSLRCDGEDSAGAGDEEISPSAERRGDRTDSGDRERRFFGKGPAGESADDGLGDIVS